MKPLELEIWPSPSEAGWAAGKSEAKAKRFTDAELAAEYWRAADHHTRLAANVLATKGSLDSPNLLASFADAEQKGLTIQRFATLPHALVSP